MKIRGGRSPVQLRVDVLPRVGFHHYARVPSERRLRVALSSQHYIKALSCDRPLLGEIPPGVFGSYGKLARHLLISCLCSNYLLLQPFLALSSHGLQHSVLREQLRRR